MDMSLPAATILLSNAVSKEHQGEAASLVNTVVNYSISLGLGFAGTVDVHINKGGRTPEDVLKGYRAAFYMGMSPKSLKGRNQNANDSAGMGLSGFGLFLSLTFLARSYWRDRQREHKATK